MPVIRRRHDHRVHILAVEWKMQCRCVTQSLHQTVNDILWPDGSHNVTRHRPMLIQGNGDDSLVSIARKDDLMLEFEGLH